jgi:hypothetical protein
MSSPAIVHIVDDNKAVHVSFGDLVRSLYYQVASKYLSLNRRAEAVRCENREQNPWRGSSR